MLKFKLNLKLKQYRLFRNRLNQDTTVYYGRPRPKYHVKSPKYLSGNSQKKCLDIPKKFLNISKNLRNISYFVLKISRF